MCFTILRINLTIYESCTLKLTILHNITIMYTTILHPPKPKPYPHIARSIETLALPSTTKQHKACLLSDDNYCRGGH